MAPVPTVAQLDRALHAVQLLLEPAGIAAQEAFFRSIGMPVRIPALSCGRQDEADLADLASRCSYGRTRTIGTFRVLGYDDILAIYQLANNEE